MHASLFVPLPHPTSRNFHCIDSTPTTSHRSPHYTSHLTSPHPSPQHNLNQLNSHKLTQLNTRLNSILSN